MTAVRMGNPNVIQVCSLSRKVNYNLLVLIKLQAYDFYCAALINYQTQISRGIMCTNDTRDRVSTDSSDRHLDRLAIDARSTSRLTLGRPSVDTPSTSRSTDFSFSLTLYRVALDTSDDHTFHVGRRVDRYLTVGCR